MEQAQWVGIDVAKTHLDVAVGETARVRRFANTPAGHRRLLAALRDSEVAGIVLEATGAYYQVLMATLQAAGYAPTALNPQWFKAYKRSAGRRAKTDALDAQGLACYGREKEPVPTRPVSPAEQALRDLVLRREDVVAARTAEKNRRQQATETTIRASIDAHLAWLTAEIRRLEAAIDAAIAADPAWAAARERLESMRGVGHVTSAILIAFLPELADMDRRQLAAIVGLAPYADDSGRHRGQRRIAGGRSLIRRVLYQAALAASRHEPVFVAQKARMRAAHKPHKVIVVAIARRMLGVLGAMERERITWDQTRLNAGVGDAATAPPEAAAA
jgi:transposase